MLKNSHNRETCNCRDSGVVDTGSKFATGVVDTGGKVTYSSEYMPPISTTPVANNGSNSRTIYECMPYYTFFSYINFLLSLSGALRVNALLFHTSQTYQYSMKMKIFDFHSPMLEFI
jgi:hypothetical protein